VTAPADDRRTGRPIVIFEASAKRPRADKARGRFLGRGETWDPTIHLSQVKPLRGSPERYDTDHEIFSHPLDALRYLLVNLPAAHSNWLSRGYDDLPHPGLDIFF
jgi:hypothetical protein